MVVPAEELEQYLKTVFEKLESEQDAQLKCKFLIFQMSSALIRIAYTVTDDCALFQRFAMLEGPIRGIQGSFHGTLPGSLGTGQRGQEKSSQILCEKAMQIIDKGVWGSVPVSGGRQQQHSCESQLPKCPDQKGDRVQASWTC